VAHYIIKIKLPKNCEMRIKSKQRYAGEIKNIFSRLKKMFWCSTVHGGQLGGSSMHKVQQTKRLVHRTLVLFEELHSVGCWLIGRPDKMPGQMLMSLNWADKLDSVLCVKDAS